MGEKHYSQSVFPTCFFNLSLSTRLADGCSMQICDGKFFFSTNIPVLLDLGFQFSLVGLFNGNHSTAARN